MLTNFKVNKENFDAVEGQQGISKTGLYIGKIAQAESCESPRGADYVELVFVANKWRYRDTEEVKGDGKKVQAVRIYLTSSKENGKQPIFGVDIFNALVGAMGLSEINTVKTKIYDTAGGTTHIGERIKDIERPIGLLLQKAPYSFVKDGEEVHGYRMNVISSFDPQTMQTAKEKAENRSAEYIENRYQTLSDKPEKRSHGAGSYQNSTPSADKYVDDGITAETIMDDAPF